MKNMGRIARFAKIVMYVDNWQDVLRVYFGRKQSTTIRFRNGITLEVHKSDIPTIISLCGVRNIVDGRDYLLFGGLKVLKTNTNKIKKAGDFILHGGDLVDTPKGIMAIIGKNRFLVGDNLDGTTELHAIFDRGVYNSLDPKGKKVLDIGAFIGDTAVWLSRGGATRVIAYEPYKPMFDLAVQNIDLNHDSSNIEICNCGVGKERKTVQLNVVINGCAANRIEMGKGRITKDTANTSKISIVSIKSVLERVGRVDAIKMNCEGAEYGILEAIAEQGLRDLAGNEIIVATHDLDEKRNSGYARELLKSCGYTRIKTVARCSKESLTIYAKREKK